MARQLILDNYEQELSRISTTDHLPIAKFITKIEKNDLGIQEFIKNCSLTSDELLSIGITGGAGVGKSTFIDKFTIKALEDKKSVAIIAIDPTSKITHGTFLGDRLCFSSNFPKQGVYIRSIASLDSLNGVPQNLGMIIKLLKIIGFNLILVETIGIGQGNTTIKNYVDRVITIPSNDSDDWTQQFKLGLNEITDLYFVNKIDKVQIDHISLSLKDYLSINAAFHQKLPIVLEGSAKQNIGVEQAYYSILEKLVK